MNILRDLLLPVISGLVLSGILFTAKSSRTRLISAGKSLTRRFRKPVAHPKHLLSYPTFDFDFVQIKDYFYSLPYEERGVYLWYIRGEHKEMSDAAGVNFNPETIIEDSLRIVVFQKKLAAFERLFNETPAKSEAQ